LKITFPIKLISEANNFDHWRVKKKRKDAIKLIMRSKLSQLDPPELPCKITITRIAPRPLDIDNLWYTQKTCIDIICDFLIPGLKPGLADSSSQIELDCKQRKGKAREYAVEVEISPCKALK